MNIAKNTLLSFVPKRVSKDLLLISVSDVRHSKMVYKT